MKFAIEEAKQAMARGEVPVGAVIVRGGKIIARAGNTREERNNSLCHAEINAINAACGLCGRVLSDCDIYVTLEPCAMCAGAIIESRIRRVYFGAYERKSGSFSSVADFSILPYPHKPEIYGGISEDECAALMTSFFEGRRR